MHAHEKAKQKHENVDITYNLEEVRNEYMSFATRSTMNPTIADLKRKNDAPYDRKDE